MSFRKNLRRYVRFEQQSIQGKFTTLLLTVAVAIGLLFLFNFWYINNQQERQQQLLKVWYPTAEALNKLSIFLEAGNTQEQQYASISRQLNGYADQWNNDRILIYHEELLEQLEAYLQSASPDEEEANRALPEFLATQKLLKRIQAEAMQQISSYEESNQAFIARLKGLFIIEFLGFFLMGFVVGFPIINAVLKKIRHLKNHVSDISKGFLSHNLEVRNDEFYTIAQSLNQLIGNLREVTHFAGEVGRGNLDAALNAFDEQGELGRSLSEMRDSLKNVAHKDKNRRWFNEGLANFSEILRRHSGNVNELCNASIGELVKYVGALQGAVFITKSSNGQTVLQMSACYAYDRQKYLNKEIPVDSGLIGQAYLEKAPKYLREIPKNYETITTGLGQGSPESILMIPLLHNDKVEGVLELASMRGFEEHELDFLNKVTESLAASISAVRTSEDTHRLLQQSQGIAEELRAQEEEMRQNMEEMQATQEEMARAQRELAIKETNLNAFINNTTDSIITVTRDYKVGLINEVLKKRYKGTQYEGIDTGTEIMPTLGSVAEEWKGYYDRAFAGERLNFTLKSSVRGEDAWREYTIHPIADKSGKIVSVSAISRDITQKVRHEQIMAQKSAILSKVLEQKADAYLAIDTNKQVLITTQSAKDLLPDLQVAPREKDALLDLINPDKRAQWKEIFDMTISGQDIKLNTKTSLEEDVKLSLQPIKNEEGIVIAALISAKRA